MSSLLAVSALSSLMTATTAAVLRDADRIRDIHGPQAAANPPPFSALAIVILATMIGLVIRAARRRRLSSLSAENQPAPDELQELQQLVDAYLRDELSAVSLCQQLAALISRRLTAHEDPAMTAADVIAAARQAGAVETIDRAAELLDFCDSVRYGGCRPQQDVVLLALDKARLICARARD